MKNIVFYFVLLILDILTHYPSHSNELSPAVITDPPLDTTAQAGFFIFLICKAQGNPKPNVQFKINGKIQKTDGHRKIIRTFDFGASLRQQVQMDNNDDRVECSAENHLGVDTKSAKIFVIDSNGELPPGFPAITSGPTDVLSQFGKVAQMKCEVTGDPPAKVTWIKNSHEYIDLDNERFQVFGTGSLKIKNVRETDNGSYECMARNKVGTVISQSGMLQIRNHPMTPQIIDFKSKIEVSAGHGANLTCNAEGFPVPLVYWGVAISNQNGHNSENRPLSERKYSSSTIQLTDITESGSYLCLASNKMGTVRKIAQIIVKKKPMAPTLVTCTKFDATYAVIEWLPVKSNPPIDSYTLQIKDTSIKDLHLALKQIPNIFHSSLKVAFDTKRVSYNVTDLKPFTNYEARVLAVSNNIGISDPSLPIHFQTLELPPSSAPTDLYAEVNNPDSITVSWKPPLQQNGRIKGYKLYYTEKMWSPIDNWHVRETTEVKFYLTGLIPNATYYVKVNAYNLAGDGPVSDAFPILVVPGAASVPPVPTNIRGASLSSTTIQIMWSAPVMPERMILRGYELKYKVDGDQNGKVIHEKIEPDKTQYLIQNLKPATTYSISLAGKTDHGTGVSAQLTETTKDDIPGMPVGVSINLIGSTSLKVVWKGPNKKFDRVNHFIIRWHELNKDHKQNSEIKEEKIENIKKNLDNVYDYVLNNLQPNSYYKVEVRAVNGMGESSPYTFQVTKTKGENKIPSKPRDFRMTQLLRIHKPKGPILFAAHLAWNTPEMTHGTIFGYRIGISLIGPREFVKELNPKKIYRNVSGLSYKTEESDEIGYGKMYLFEVEALNEFNYGDAASINQSMPESKPTAQPSKLEIQASKNTVTLQWLPPPINFRNGIITGYKIQYYDIKDQAGSITQIDTKSQTSVKIQNLSEKTTYVFMIRAVNKEGDGPWSPGSSYYISSEFFPSPENIEVKVLNEYQIKVSWDFPSKSNLIVDLQSQVIGFHIQVSTNKDFSDDAINFKKSVGPFTTAVINEIYPNQYFIRMKSIIRDDRSAEWSNVETTNVMKLENNDRNVRNLNCLGEKDSIRVTWMRPENFNDIESFIVKVSGYRKYRNVYGLKKIEDISPRTATVLFSKEGQTLYSYVLQELEPNTNYDLSIQISYSTSSKLGMISKTTSCVTLMSQPQKVLPPTAKSLRKLSNNIVLRLWRADEKFGRISHYYLIVSPDVSSHITPNDVNINETLMNTIKMKSINSKYVAAQFTPALFKSNMFVDFVLGSDNPIENFKRSDYIHLKKLSIKKKMNMKAFLRACIIPEGVRSPNTDQTCTSSEWSKLFNTDINKEIGVFTLAVIAGIGSIILLLCACIGFACYLKRSHSKISRPLSSTDPCLKQPLMMQPGLSGGTLPQYTNIINTGNSSRHGYSDSLRTNSDLCATTGIITPINNHQPLSVSNPMFEQRSLELKKISNTQAPDLVQNALSISNSVRPPIPVHRLESQLNELRANDNFLFSQEYESIDPGQQFTWENSNLEVNRAKNRYANVIAYDHSRILLQSINGIPGSDYINANYIDGYKRPNAYIATQGPLSNTFGDFWRMVWEQGTTTIVMMTKLEERTRIKCDQYWPNKGIESYADGAINVAITDTKELAYYTIRTFIISANYTSNSSEFCSNKEKREIRQYQFTAWPDHGVPDNPMPLLMFLKRIRAGNPPNSGPIIVHCSAGVGRTGAFIVIDTTIERIRHEMTVDIFGQVSIMRAQRNYMVQTEDQYVFVHEVVLDAVRASNTEVSLQNISSHVQKLLRTDCSTGTQRANGIELEFQKLSQFKPNNARCTSANLPVNRLKNRLVNILPYEFNRICLQPIRGCEGSDYINASFIDGYQNIRAYIATQAPLLETVEDFWRMIWEHNSTIIVMLTKLREMGREKCHRYWPTERSSRFQYFVVDPMVEYNMPNFVLQEFKVTDARDGQSRTVRQFQFTEWPEQGVPYQATEAFIDFIGQVHKTKEQFGQEGPITVHCSAGVGRTGVFLALSIALERLKNEGVLDLFQVVRALRYQRANMVQSEEQYRFCYLAAQDYVNSFDNFFE